MLPVGTEPLVLADGTKIDPISGAVVQDDLLVEVPNTADMKREIVASRKRISDLPVPPQQMNTLSVIISYSLFGINDKDIANILAIPLVQLLTIKSSDVYKDLQDSLVENIITSDSADVRGLFVQKSRTAANKMFALMDSDNEATRLTASKDVLDRSGQRPADVVEHRHRMEGGLTIHYVEKKDNIPTIDMEDF